MFSSEVSDFDFLPATRVSLFQDFLLAPQICKSFRVALPMHRFVASVDRNLALLPAMYQQWLNLLALLGTSATENPSAAILIARCVADSPANPFPNQPATAQ